MNDERSEQPNEGERDKKRVTRRAFKALPFIRDISKEERKKIGGHGRVYWTVEASEDWIGDWQKGKGYGEAALRYMREYKDGNVLMWIVKSMFMRGNYGAIEYGFFEFLGKEFSGFNSMSHFPQYAPENEHKPEQNGKGHLRLIK